MKFHSNPRTHVFGSEKKNEGAEGIQRCEDESRDDHADVSPDLSKKDSTSGVRIESAEFSIQRIRLPKSLLFS